MLDTPQTLGETARPPVRVVAGAFRGRRLVAPSGRDTRPTSDRVRESLFMSLGSIEGFRVVDLFAGSGALGIEALSRGADYVDFAEFDRAAWKVLERNLGTVEVLDRTTIWRIELPQGLKRMTGPLGEADLILLDPPYGGAAARATLDGLGRAALKMEVRVVVEHHRKDELLETAGPLRRVREQAYGETCVTTYRGTTDRPPARRDDGS